MAHLSLAWRSATGAAGGAVWLATSMTPARQRVAAGERAEFALMPRAVVVRLNAPTPHVCCDQLVLRCPDTAATWTHAPSGTASSGLLLWSLERTMTPGGGPAPLDEQRSRAFGADPCRRAVSALVPSAPPASGLAPCCGDGDLERLQPVPGRAAPSARIWVPWPMAWSAAAARCWKRRTCPPLRPAPRAPELAELAPACAHSLRIRPP